MLEEYKKTLAIPLSHSLVITTSVHESIGGNDLDVHFCDEVDEYGNIVAHYKVCDTKQRHPPFERLISFSLI